MASIPPSAQDIVITGTPLRRDPNDLTIIAAGQSVSGWEEIELTLRCESFPNSFSIGMSVQSPTTSKMIAGAPCNILLGNDQVITGYVDSDAGEAEAEGHRITVTGRGKTQDLVDCSAEWATGQLLSQSLEDIATKVCLPYGIAVKMLSSADPGSIIPQLALTYGETGADLLQRLARNAGLLAYEDASGALCFSTAGTTSAASGATYGQNVQAYTAEHSMTDRMSEIVCTSHNMDNYGDLGDGSFFFATATDPNVPRHRRRYIVIETAVNAQAFTEKKAKWEAARNAARGTVLRVTLDSWRDSGGKLWMPNTKVPVDVPAFHGPSPLVISEVTFRKSSEGGTTADLLLIPSLGLTPEPLSLQPVSTAGLQ